MKLQYIFLAATITVSNSLCNDLSLALLEESRKDTPDVSLIEKLLRQGADPNKQDPL